ncbi:Protein of unknown function [Cotesia congregata]|uniref:Uncharacterized protein n=1 Tax=Cotesia congregata TaxID=51543 RepID=A0A8J2H5D5_COTCN|nr:Protein of unknown function [Cotesia congregata]
MDKCIMITAWTLSAGQTYGSELQLQYRRNSRLPRLGVYLLRKIIIKGALDRVLPIEYINMLRKIRYNGFMDSYSDIGQEVVGIYLDCIIALDFVMRGFPPISCPSRIFRVPETFECAQSKEI